jgi:nitrite reductase (NADH) small subunit
VARLAELEEGKGKEVMVEGATLALFRIAGAVYAIDNVCPHREGPLAFGDLRDCTVYCPLHAWPFDVRNGACLEFPAVRVRSFPVRIEGEHVQVEL